MKVKAPGEMGQDKGLDESGWSSRHQARGLDLKARGQKWRMAWGGAWEIKDVPTKARGS